MNTPHGQRNGDQSPVARQDRKPKRRPLPVFRRNKDYIVLKDGIVRPLTGMSVSRAGRIE